MSAKLLSPFHLREVKIRNRVWMAPMCQYMAVDGVANSWHQTHLISRAVGGVGLVMLEATAVTAQGRITPGCLGLWNETQEKALQPIVDEIRGQNATVGIQLAHAGRKASSHKPWNGGKGLLSDQGAWPTVSASPLAFSTDTSKPHELTRTEMDSITESFLKATERSVRAGFQIVELHMAHGYLLHQFLSPLSNQRTDEFGGSFENRSRFPLQVTKAIRQAWPQNLPLFVRLSVTDWAQEGWDLQQSLVLCQELKKIGVDLIDCSSGGLVPHAKIPAEPGYQVPFADRIRQDVQIPTAAVGLITTPHQIEDILLKNQADAVFLARELLRNPYFVLNAEPLFQNPGPTLWPDSYLRAKLTP